MLGRCLKPEAKRQCRKCLKRVIATVTPFDIEALRSGAQDPKKQVAILELKARSSYVTTHLTFATPTPRFR